jgi:hypothetical protein
VVGSTDIALDRDGRFLYQLRAFEVPDGAVAVQPRIAVLRVTGNFATNAGLETVQTLELPADLDVTGVMGLAIAEQ